MQILSVLVALSTAPANQLPTPSMGGRLAVDVSGLHFLRGHVAFDLLLLG